MKLQLITIVAILALLVACAPRAPPAAPSPAPVAPAAPTTGPAEAADAEVTASEITAITDDLGSLEEELSLENFEDDLGALDALEFG